MAIHNLTLGDGDGKPHVRIEVAGYQHPDTREPHGMDLLRCHVYAQAHPVQARFEVAIRVEEFAGLRDYLQRINSGNGPSDNFSFAGGLFELSFAPSRRGPVLCAVRLKSIETSHVRLEYLITLEPESITRALTELATLDASM